MVTPADNPHKPGTPEHRTWEHVNVHEPRRYPGIERDTATERANGRMAALKARMTPQAERNQWVADICAEVEAATRECGPNRKPLATAAVITAPFGLTADQLKAFRDQWTDNSIDRFAAADDLLRVWSDPNLGARLLTSSPPQGDTRYNPDTRSFEAQA